MTRSKGRQARAWAVQVVHIADPDITSAAALVLLARKYVSLDKSIYTEFRMHRIRNKWMKKLMLAPDEEGGLTCAICGKKGLRPNDSDPHKKATLDHIIEISDGGDWRDPSNFQILCKDCNSHKNDLFQKKKLYFV